MTSMLRRLVEKHDGRELASLLIAQFLGYIGVTGSPLLLLECLCVVEESVLFERFLLNDAAHRVHCLSRATPLHRLLWEQPTPSHRRISQLLTDDLEPDRLEQIEKRKFIC